MEVIQLVLGIRFLLANTVAAVHVAVTYLGGCAGGNKNPTSHLLVLESESLCFKVGRVVPRLEPNWNAADPVDIGVMANKAGAVANVSESTSRSPPECHVISHLCWQSLSPRGRLEHLAPKGFWIHVLLQAINKSR